MAVIVCHDYYASVVSQFLQVETLKNVHVFWCVLVPHGWWQAASIRCARLSHAHNACMRCAARTTLPQTSSEASSRRRVT